MTTNLNLKTFKQYIRFCIIGCLNFGVDLGFYWILTRNVAFFGHIPILAHVLSFSIAILNSYFWNSRWVFHSAKLARVGEHTSRFTKFYVVQTIGLGFSTLCFMLLTTPQWLIPKGGFLIDPQVAFTYHDFLLRHTLLPPFSVINLGPISFHADIIAKFLTAILVSLWNFPANKFWAFKSK